MVVMLLGNKASLGRVVISARLVHIAAVVVGARGQVEAGQVSVGRPFRSTA